MRRIFAPLAGLLAFAPAPALADKLRDLCHDRPGLGTPACTIDPGHVLIEVGLGDWTLDRQPDTRIDTILSSDVAIHYGLGPTTEIQFGLTGFGHVRTRDRTTGEVTRQAGVGDATFGLRQNLVHPGGRGLSVALQPYMSLPIGRQPVGAGDWGAGLLVPITYALSKTVQIALTPAAEAAVDEDGGGRHLAYGSVAGATIKLAPKLSATIEGQATRDRDPMDPTTQALAAVALAYQPSSSLQFDVGSAFGLNRATPDLRLYFGAARRF